MRDAEIDCLRREVTDLRRTVERIDAVLTDLSHQVRGLVKDAQRSGSQFVTRKLSVVPNYRTLGERLSEDDGA